MTEQERLRVEAQKKRAAAIKKKADAEGYRPDPPWVKKMYAKKSKARSRGRARIKADRAKRKMNAKIRKAKRITKRKMPDHDEDFRFEDRWDLELR